MVRGFENSLLFYEKSFSGDATQVKAWRSCESIDLHSSGGHRAQINDGSVYPVRFILKHYPLRSFDQIRRKLTSDRVQRFAKDELDKGWHRQYDSIPQHVIKCGFWDSSTLMEFCYEKEISKLFYESIEFFAMQRIEEAISRQDLAGRLRVKLIARGYNPAQVGDFLAGVFSVANRVYNDIFVSVEVDDATRRVFRYCLRYIAASYLAMGDARLADNLFKIYANGEMLFSKN